ncbi:MAG: prepilin-type N-terminal cleavage/methylation domain-containing protein [Verrucomicrobia bacterium]|nr:prepilin-type N-terminal cleavage/methylation domain-containing protein [Verrucomicrobiota bacterium]
MNPLQNSSNSRHHGFGFTLVELLVVVAIIAVLAALALPALGRSKAKAYEAACVGNLRQLGIATRAYASDHQDRLPSAEILPSQPIDPQKPLPRICDVLAPYVGKQGGTNATAATVFKCPAERRGRFAAEGSSYEWNHDLNGERLDETRTDSAFLLLKKGDFSGGVTNFFMSYPPATIPLLLDYESVHAQPPKLGKNVVFMDGHVAPLAGSPTANP